MGWRNPPTVYMILNLVFLLLCMAVCFRMLWHGIKSLFTFKANSDSGLSLAVFAVLVQSIYACFFPNQIMSGSLHLYSVLAAGGLFLNSLGKLVMSRRIWNNFRFVASRESKYAVQLYDDYNTSLKLAKDCVIDSPVIAYQHKTGFLSRFLQYSYEPDPLETNSQTLAPIGLIASLALCIACLVLSQSAAEAISAFAACACICVPFTSMLAGNLLLGKLAALGKKCGAMAVGYPAVEKFSSVNAVMMDAQELYPKGTIILNGIKTFGNQRIDEAILEATALMCAAGGPLVSVFDQIIKTRREILPEWISRFMKTAGALPAGYPGIGYWWEIVTCWQHTRSTRLPMILKTVTPPTAAKRYIWQLVDSWWRFSCSPIAPTPIVPENSSAWKPTGSA